MKENWLNLSRSRRILLLINAAMVVIFFFLYLIPGNRRVCRYDESLFAVTESETALIYSGELGGADVEITITPGNTLTYRIDGEDCGTFTVKEDPSAAPNSDSLLDGALLTGVEIRKDGEIFFRGGYRKYTSGLLLIDQELFPSSGPESFDRPSAHAVLHFALFGNSVRQGNWLFFLVALSFAALTFLTAFFQEPFFRAHMALTRDEREHTKVPTYRKVLSWIFWSALSLGTLSLLIAGLLAL